MAAPLSPSMAKFRNAAHRATAFTPRKEKQKKEDDILPVQVTLGKTKLTFTDQGWKLDPSVTSQYEKKIEELTKQINDVSRQAEKWERDSRSAKNGGERLMEEANMTKFKNQLLIEMLAIAQLDEQQAMQNYQREKLKADEYRGELERCYARMLTLGLDPSATMDSPSKPLDMSGTFGTTFASSIAQHK